MELAGYAILYMMTSLLTTLFANASVILQLIGSWFTFKKMKLPGWKGIIPYYSTYILFTELWEKKKFWTLIKFLIAYICTFFVGYTLVAMGVAFVVTAAESTAETNGLTVVGIITIVIGSLLLIAAIVLMIMALIIEFKLYKRMAGAFGLKDAWAWGLLFVPFIMLPIIGFNKKIMYYGPVEQV